MQPGNKDVGLMSFSIFQAFLLGNAQSTGHSLSRAQEKISDLTGLSLGWLGRLEIEGKNPGLEEDTPNLHPSSHRVLA